MNDTAAMKPWQIEVNSILEVFESASRAYPDRIYCKSSEITLTYEQASRAVAGFAQRYRADWEGQTVALVLPNSAAFSIAFYGLLAAGATPALVNYTHPDSTVVRLLENTNVVATLSDRTIPNLSVTPFSNSSLTELGNAAPLSANDCSCHPDSIAAILFSGGTTGLPKQVAHSNRMLIAAMERIEWGWPTQNDEIWLPVAPFTHVYGFLMGVLNPVLRAGTLIIPGQFHPDTILAALVEEAVTMFGGGPPAIYQAIMAATHFGSARFPSLRTCPGGGAPFPLAVHERWTTATGLPITEGYGMTEIAPICINNPSGIKPGAAGRPAPDTAVEIVDIETGSMRLAQGETGEIRVKGPHMMQGYTANEDESALTLKQGYVYTGDIGHIDDEGFLIISDRKKDVIFVKGYNVFPREIEEALLANEGVLGACVVGREDEKAGELPVAFITAQSAVNTAALSHNLAKTLAPYKLPTAIHVVDAFPMTPAAKVDRKVLREQAKQNP